MEDKAGQDRRAWMELLGLDNMKCTRYNHTSHRGLGSKSGMKVNTFFFRRRRRKWALIKATVSAAGMVWLTVPGNIWHLQHISDSSTLYSHVYKSCGFYLPKSEFNTFIFIPPHFVILVRILVCTTREWSRSELGHLHHVVRIHRGT